MPESVPHGSVATTAIESLRSSPPLLMIVLLNVVFAVIAGYYLLQVEGYRAEDRKQVMQLVEKCMKTN